MRLGPTIDKAQHSWALAREGARPRQLPPSRFSGVRSRGPQRVPCRVRASQEESPGPAAPPIALSDDRPAGLPAVSEAPSTSGRAPVQYPAGAAAPLPPGHVLGGKYTVLEVLGAGSNAVAYRARAPDGSEVAAKALSLRQLRDWKQLELFQREGRTLAALAHPAIPRYLDYFEEDTPQDRCFVIVQEVVRGKSLAAMVQEGQRATDQEVARIADSLLLVLEYLGSLRPPVIHRDIKPDNIVLEGGVWGGRVFLVDFGGVQAVASAGDLAGLGSTIVGTYGYMAPEQFRGAAEPASDLYGLGGTLLYVMTGQPPSAFPVERMRINWRQGLSMRQGGGGGAASASAPLAALLDGLLEPLAEDRLSAGEARALLRGEAVSPRPAERPDRATSGFAKRRAAVQRMPPPPPATVQEAYLAAAANAARAPARPVPRPAGTRVLLEREGRRLDITIPPKGLTMDVAFTGSFALVWNGFVAAWTIGALASGGLLFALFSAPFWLAGAQLARGALGGALLKERLAIGANRWRLGQQLAVLGRDGQADFLDGKNEQRQEGPSSELLGARVVTTAFINGEPQTAIELVGGSSRHRFGEGLELREQQWLVGEINEHIAGLKGRDVDFDAMPAPEVPRVVNDTPSEDGN